MFNQRVMLRPFSVLILCYVSSFSESNVVYDDSTDPTYRRKDVALLVAHELVHQWFGNLVTPKWWSYLWLSEGFAAFFEAYFVDKVLRLLMHDYNGH